MKRLYDWQIKRKVEIFVTILLLIIIATILTMLAVTLWNSTSSLKDKVWISLISLFLMCCLTLVVLDES